jgi:hypothetical protein
MSNSHVVGFPRDFLLTMLLQNIEGRCRFIEQHPLPGALLSERAIGLDDVKLEWSSLVFLAKYKRQPRRRRRACPG